MNKKVVKCPNCGDTWEYSFKVDHGNGKCIVTKTYDFIEEGQECICYKCHSKYTVTTTEPSDIKMDDFIYYVWRHCKM